MGIFLIILGIVVLIVGAVVFVSGFKEGDRRNDAQSPGPIRVGIAATLALGGIATGVIGLGLTTVDARSVGIETKGGKYVDTLQPGRHFLAPWAEVEQWTTRNQTIVFEGNDGEDKDNRWDEAALPVRLANQSTASVDATVTWAIADTGGDFAAQKARIQKLWAQYKSFDDMARNFVVSTVRGTAGDVFNPYDPFTALEQGKTDNPFIPNAEWSKRITAALSPKLATFGLTLVSVQVTQVKYDDQTEAKVRAYSAKLADTRIAQQDIEIAKAQAQASKERATQAAPGCEALIRDLAAMGKLQDLPPAFNCGQAGGGVLVGGK